MAITIESNPGILHALYGNGTQFKVSTDRVMGTSDTATITSATDPGAVHITFYTSAAHGFSVGDIVTLDTTVSGYDGVHEITTIPTTTSFHISGTYSATATGTAIVNNYNFKIKCEIQDSTGATVYATKYIYPVTESGSQYFYLDLDNILKSLVDSEHQSFAFNAYVKTGLSCNVIYDVKFTEVFDDEDGASKTGSYLVSSGNTVCNNMTADYTPADFEIQDGDERFLTDSPRLEITTAEEMQLHANMSDVYQVKVTYEMGANPGDTQVVQWYPSAASSTRPDEQRLIIPINQAFLDTAEGTTRFATCYQFALTLYDVVGGADSGNPLSETLTFYKKSADCNRITVQFLNHLGGFDNFTFKNQYPITTRVEREMYKSAGVDRQRNVQAKRKRLLISDWLNDTYLDFAEQLLTSPEVYLLEDSEWKPVNIITSEMKKRSNDLINLEIEIEGQELNIIK